MFNPFKRVELAWKLAMGYKLKALSLFIFMTVSFGVIIAGFNLVVSSFNGWFSRELSFMQPNYYVSAFKAFDWEIPDYGFKNQSLSDEQRSRIRAALADMRVFDGIYIPGMLAIGGQESRNQKVLAIGVDFARAREIFPSIAKAFTQDEMLAFKASRTMLVDKKLATRAGYADGQEFVFLADNYWRSVNGIRMKSATFRSPLSDFKIFSEHGIVWIDLDSLALLGGMPEGRRWPIFALADKPVIGAESFFRERSLDRDLAPLGASYVTPLTSMEAMRSTFTMFAAIMAFLGIVIAVIVSASTSSNLFINFQNRKADFGLMKAFGFGSRDFFVLIFMENLFTLGIAAACALGINLATAAAFPAFELVNFPCSLRVTFPCLVLTIAIVVAMNLVSIMRPFAYLMKVDPANIMREE